MLFQRVFKSDFVGRQAIVKERFPKKYRHPALDSKLTLKRLNAVSFLYLDALELASFLLLFYGAHIHIPKTY